MFYLGRYLFVLVYPLSSFSFEPVLHSWCNRLGSVISCLWVDAYKRFLAANLKLFSSLNI